MRLKDGATNIWENLLSGGNPKQLTHFTSGELFDYAWSPDGKDLFLARGEFGGDRSCSQIYIDSLYLRLALRK